MKKLILSGFTIAAFAIYAILSRGGPAAPAAASATPPSSITSSAPRQSSAGAAAGSGGYNNGSYTGSQADALYGTVQVKAVIQNGRLTDVQFLSQPTDRRRSQSINSQATPILKQEAIQAQSANVQAVSGATLTSEAFVQSLQSALSQAKA
ncbi:MAG TPA: FMN-binding protein [Thermoleophilia bacterium]